ncbi:MAG: MotA/TolQ/ExbB proton channel family protein [Comamonas sp.]
MTPVQWLAQTDWVSRCTAGVLLAMSVASWVMIAAKWWWLARAGRDTPRAIHAFWQAPDWAQAAQQASSLDRSGIVGPAVAAMQGLTASATGLAAASGTPVQATRVLRDALLAAARQLQWGQTLLATIGATAPFVGLLGTVWGIHQALVALAGTARISIEQLAGPVGEALVMTAAGLAVAIPAVLAYNLLGRRAALVEEQLEGLAHDLCEWAKGRMDAEDPLASPAGGMPGAHQNLASVGAR